VRCCSCDSSCDSNHYIDYLFSKKENYRCSKYISVSVIQPYGQLGVNQPYGQPVFNVSFFLYYFYFFYCKKDIKTISNGFILKNTSFNKI
jgi:hypothetical protein